MRKIQIERKLFELFGHKFLVFEDFEDGDLNIDDKSIYQHDDQEMLVEIFARNKFYSIWGDERRHHAGLICACYGNLNIITNFLQKIGISETCYSTFNCELQGEDRVLYLSSSEAMHAFINQLDCVKHSAKTVSSKSNVIPLRREEILQK